MTCTNNKSISGEIQPLILGKWYSIIRINENDIWVQNENGIIEHYDIIDYFETE